jgi:4-hydroxy-tetrahydrodipicolinate synthase
MFQGSIVALVTPMTENGRIDFEALGRLVDFQLANGTCGFVVAGTTGESATLSEQELEQLWSAVVSQVGGRVPVIAGSGTYDTSVTIARTQLAEHCGVDAALLVTPYYNKPTQAGLAAHYTAIHEASRLPLILYNVPGRTAVDLLPETVGRLAGLERVVAIKEAVPDPQRVGELLERCGQQLTVLSGDDASCMAAMLRGAGGVISVAANVAPAMMGQLCRLALAGDQAASMEANRRLAALYRALMLESNPIPVKWALQRMGLIEGGIRLPLTPLDPSYHPEVENALRDASLLMA